MIQTLIVMSFLFFTNDSPKQLDPCEIYGKVYIISDPNRADYRVYVEDSESFCDVIVFKEQSALYADNPGHWTFVENSGLANVWVYIEKNKDMADFSIYYTDYESFAGCNR